MGLPFPFVNRFDKFGESKTDRQACALCER
jgi:hypothetical protein